MGKESTKAGAKGLDEHPDGEAPKFLDPIVDHEVRCFCPNPRAPGFGFATHFAIVRRK